MWQINDMMPRYYYGSHLCGAPMELNAKKYHFALYYVFFYQKITSPKTLRFVDTKNKKGVIFS